MVQTEKPINPISWDYILECGEDNAGNIFILKEVKESITQLLGKSDNKPSDQKKYLEENYLEVHAISDDGTRNTFITKNIATGKYLLDLCLDNQDIKSITIFKAPQIAQIFQE